MLILAIDTAQGSGSVTLARGQEIGIEVLGTSLVEGGTFSARLVPTIAELLAAHKLTQNDIEGVAVSIGPGSFTGLRIGLTAAKGFAETLNIPLIGVSRFDAIAESFQGGADPLFVALHAGPQEAYAAEFRRVESSWSVARKWFCKAQSLAGTVQTAGPAAAVITVEPKLAEALVEFGASPFDLPPVGSEAIARLGWKQLAAGACTSVDGLDAEYIRRDDELFSVK